MAGEKILVVDDEEDILELLQYNLSRDGFTVVRASTGEQALASARGSPPDLVLLDLMLPGINGLDLCKRFRADERLAAVPIIIVSAKGEEADVVAGLELGADDYVTKPFSVRTLLARIRAVLRRRGREPIDAAESLKIHGLVIHPGRHEVIANGKAVDLTASEFRILHYLARRPGWVFTRGQIIDAVHGEEYPVTDRSVDVQVAALRKKLGKAGERIETVRGVGYRCKE
ncbi:MAG TPA: DNA-binding response regulator [Planctomycetes bacterium]|nr:DNA-binding response regulator [Planctomycetota bacterium]